MRTEPTREGGATSADAGPPVPTRAARVAVALAAPALFVAVWLVAALAEGSPIPAPRWRLTAVFLATIAGLMVAPLPGGAVVLLGVTATVLTGALPLEKALGGYSEPSVWLVLAAFLTSRAFLKTGLARRIALSFVRLLGRTTLGLSYAVAAADACLAALIPSNGARVGGVMLPVARSLAELYGSKPGPTAGLMGAFLMLTLYQCDVTACALFLTGQTGNFVAREQALKLTHDAPGGPVVMDYAGWLANSCVPAGACLLLTPLVVFALQTPGVRSTPDAAEFARERLRELGLPGRDERVLIGVYVVVVALWVALDAGLAPVVALGAVASLLVTGVLTWDEVVGERAAWDVFVWYGGLVMLGRQLSEAGVTRVFAEWVASAVGPWPWLTLFFLLVPVYFYCHYAFAGITTHLIAVYPAFAGVLIAAGAPGPLVVWSLAFIANPSAGLTHYGTTHAPLVFGAGYVSAREWWRVGLLVSFVNVGVWMTLGTAWWKWRGLW